MAPRRPGPRWAASLGLRAAVLADVRRFFGARAYLEVETPALVPALANEVHVDAFEVPVGPAGRAAFLSPSPELQMKRLVCDGLERIFQLGRAFRRDEAGPWHNPEFTLLEWYRVGAGVEDMMDETEALVRAVANAHGGGRLRADGAEAHVAGSFLRLTVTEAFARHAGLEAAETERLAVQDEERFFRLLCERVEPALARAGVPVFLHDYPASLGSLARLRPERPHVAERFELYAAGIELSNGFGELSDPAEQRRRFARDAGRRAALGKVVYPLDERFLAALERGMPSCAGNALGIDRLVALSAGVSLREVLAFPADEL
jgi:lysyl-tRNA synthetase class 2